MNKITILSQGRFTSRHPNGVTVYYDSRHRVIKTRLEGDVVSTLVQERLEDGSYRTQLLTVGHAIIME